MYVLICTVKRSPVPERDRQPMRVGTDGNEKEDRGMLVTISPHDSDALPNEALSCKTLGTLASYPA